MKNIILPVFLSAAAIFPEIPFPARGVNLGDWLDAPKNEYWGVDMDSADFVNIAQKGFNNIRIPARFSDYITNEKRVSFEFMKKVKWAVDQTVNNKMTAIVDVHHFEEMRTQPEEYFEILKNIWEDISLEFAQYSDSSVLFELMNEPNGATTIELWNKYPSELIKIIRKTNKTRPILLGTADWGGFSTVKPLKIPDDDNLIITLHYYNPSKFTHQGADWVQGGDEWLGTRWTGNAAQKLSMKQDFEEVFNYAKQKNLKIHIGEFGAYGKAKYEDRVLWTEYAAQLCNHFGFAFSYWEYSSGFGLYDPKTKNWREELVSALFSTKEILDDDYSVFGENLIRGNKWTYGVWNAAGSADFQIENGVISVNVSKVTPEIWEIQVIKENLGLEAKAYLLSFDVEGDEGMVFDASLTDKNYQVFGGVTVSVPSKNVKAVIQAEETDNSGRLAFSFGYAAGNAVISNVSLREIIIDDTPIADKKSKNKTAAVKNQKVFISKNIINAAPNAEFEIVSANGKILFSGKCGITGKAEIKDMPKGVYTIKIKNTVSLKYVRK